MAGSIRGATDLITITGKSISDVWLSLDDNTQDFYDVLRCHGGSLTKGELVQHLMLETGRGYEELYFPQVTYKLKTAGYIEIRKEK